MSMATINVRQRLPPVVAAVIRPVSTRLSRMEDLIIEMRTEQEVKLKKIVRLQDQINGLQEQFDKLVETLRKRSS